MSKVKVYQLEIEFPLAFFKIPYTVKTRKTYLIPRKKAILSIFNAFFEKPISFWKISGKNKLQNEEKLLDDFLVGVELINFEKTIEKQRIVQIKSSGVERPPSETELITNVKYVFYLVPKKEIKINKDPINYYPFAGQNEYLAIYWKLYILNGEIEKSNNAIFENYQLITKDIVRFAEEIAIENALEKYVVVRGRVEFSQQTSILKLGSKYIFIF